MPTDYRPNCTINLYFYEGDAALGVKPRFSYYCTDSSQGWHVQTDGSIHPPSKNRIVEIRLRAYPIDWNRPARFAGFRMGLMDAAQKQTRNWTPQDDLAGLGVTILTPYPSDKDEVPWSTLGPLAFDMTNSPYRLAYSVAVSLGDSEPVWDDPKIYDDGSE